MARLPRLWERHASRWAFPLFPSCSAPRDGGIPIRPAAPATSASVPCSTTPRLLRYEQLLAWVFSSGRRIQIGGTLGVVYNTNKLQTAYVFQNHPALAGLKTRLDLKTSGTGWNGSVGVIAQPSKALRFGAAYKSRTRIVSKGSAAGNADVQFAAIGLGGARPDFRYDAQVDNVLPQSVAVHGEWAVKPSLRAVAQVDWINWKTAFADLRCISLAVITRILIVC